MILLIPCTSNIISFHNLTQFFNTFMISMFTFQFSDYLILSFQLTLPSPLTQFLNTSYPLKSIVYITFSLSKIPVIVTLYSLPSLNFVIIITLLCTWLTSLPFSILIIFLIKVPKLANYYALLFAHLHPSS